jgi:hypothetical protein
MNEVQTSAAEGHKKQPPRGTMRAAVVSYLGADVREPSSSFSSVLTVSVAGTLIP